MIALLSVGEEEIYVGLGISVFVIVAGVAEKSIVAEALHIAVFDSGEQHKSD